MPESEQGKGSEGSAEQGSPTTERRDMGEKAAGFRGAQPATQTDVEMVQDAPQAEPGAESAEVDVTQQGGPQGGADSDAVSHASPPAAKPGEKDDPDEDDPDMKDMATGPRPADDQAGG